MSVVWKKTRVVAGTVFKPTTCIEYNSVLICNPDEIAYNLVARYAAKISSPESKPHDFLERKTESNKILTLKLKRT